MKLDHFLIRARELDQMRDFFLNVIGLEVGARPDFQFPGYWMYSENMPVVHLALNSKPADESGAGDDLGPVDHIAFTADDYRGLMDRLKATGATFEERTVPGGAAHQVFVHGPEGVKVEIQFSSASTS